MQSQQQEEARKQRQGKGCRAKRERGKDSRRRCVDACGRKEGNEIHNETEGDLCFIVNEIPAGFNTSSSSVFSPLSPSPASLLLSLIPCFFSFSGCTLDFQAKAGAALKLLSFVALISEPFCPSAASSMVISSHSFAFSLCKVSSFIDDACDPKLPEACLSHC